MSLYVRKSSGHLSSDEKEKVNIVIFDILEHGLELEASSAMIEVNN